MCIAKDVLEWMESQARIKREQTNDQWRKNCSAEEFAEFLDEVSGYEGACTVCKLVGKNTDCPRTCPYNNALSKQNWITWLKEKHEESE